VSVQFDWKQEDFELEEELGPEVQLWRELQEQVEIPHGLDQKISRIARHSITNELQASWLLSQSPKLILVMLLFFAIGLAYVLSLG
jgi:hypothetical protein